MRMAVLALGLLLVGTTTAAGQQEWADKLFAKGGTSHSFGNVPRGAVLHYRFPMYNIYAVPLQIMNTRVSCGCVTVAPSANVLQPREAGHLDITMDARRFTGPKTVTIYVAVGPQYTSTATLQVYANSRPDVVFNPGQVSFGVVQVGQSPTQAIDVEYAGVLDWRINGVAEHKLPFDVKYKELYRERGRVGYRLHVTLKPDAPPGPFKHEVLLQTNDPASLLLPVLIEGTLQAALSIAPPPPIRLASSRVGQETSFRIFVNGNGQKDFRIVAVDGQGDGLTVDFPANPDKVQVLTIKWRPAQAGALKRELTIKTDLDGGSSVKALVEGMAQ